MNKLKISLIVIGIILIPLIIYWVYQEFTSVKVYEGEISLEESVDEFKNEVEMMKEMEGADEEEFKGFQEKLLKKYSNPESAVEYLLSISTIKDVNLYPEAFMYEKFSADIFGHTETDKVQLIESVMERLTRNGSITKVDFIDSKWTTDRESTRVTVDFYYNDLPEPIRLNIMVTKQEVTIDHSLHNEEGAGHEGEHRTTDFYYVNTSVWEIIDTIEKGAEQ